MPYVVAVSISERARTYAYWFSGPMRIVFSILGTIGNILSLIVFTRPSMMATETNYILTSKFISFEAEIILVSFLKLKQSF